MKFNVLESLVSLTSVLINSCHLSEFNEAHFSTKNRVEPLDCGAYVNLFESLNINEAFNVLTASGREDSKWFTLPCKVNRLVHQTHYSLSLSTSLDSDLPEARIVDRWLTVPLALILFVIFIFVLFLGHVIIITTLGFPLDFFEFLSLVVSSCQLLGLIVLLLFATLNFALFIIALEVIIILIGFDFEELSDSKILARGFALACKGLNSLILLVVFLDGLDFLRLPFVLLSSE